MENTATSIISSNLKNQRKFFATGQTGHVSFRIKQLKRLKASILRNEEKIKEALWNDLHKSPEEAYLTEISIVLTEINYHIKHLHGWTRPQKVRSTMSVFPSKSRILHEPLGTALIIAPWNYPFQLLFNPLIGAISAGCCAILKTSPYAPETAKVMEEIILDCFPPYYISIAHGNRDVNQFLLGQRFDVIFFTGSPELGKTVMKSAARYLTPVILELGGKSPCIVDRFANIKLAARRIAWGKTINAGQTCIAPDYLCIHTAVKAEFIAEYKKAIQDLFGEDVKASPFYGRIVNEAAFERLRKLMQDGNIVIGGETDATQKYIAPTVIDNVETDFPIMQEEIFGPILPVLTFNRSTEIVRYINKNPKPLALYYFGQENHAFTTLRQTSSGGACINDTIMHIANHHLPFGGVGQSGMGKYHGKDSFLSFSNRRAVVVARNWLDLPFRYSPYKLFNVIKKLL